MPSAWLIGALVIAQPAPERFALPSAWAIVAVVAVAWAIFVVRRANVRLEHALQGQRVALQRWDYGDRIHGAMMERDRELAARARKLLAVATCDASARVERDKALEELRRTLLRIGYAEDKEIS